MWFSEMEWRWLLIPLSYTQMKHGYWFHEYFSLYFCSIIERFYMVKKPNTTRGQDTSLNSTASKKINLCKCKAYFSTAWHQSDAVNNGFQSINFCWKESVKKKWHFEINFGVNSKWTALHWVMLCCGRLREGCLCSIKLLEALSEFRGTQAAAYNISSSTSQGLSAVPTGHCMAHLSNLRTHL